MVLKMVQKKFHGMVFMRRQKNYQAVEEQDKWGIFKKRTSLFFHGQPICVEFIAPATKTLFHRKCWILKKSEGPLRQNIYYVPVQPFNLKYTTVLRSTRVYATTESNIIRTLYTPFCPNKPHQTLCSISWKGKNYCQVMEKKV